MKFIGEPLEDLKPGDIVVETIIGDYAQTTYWVIVREATDEDMVIKNSTYKKAYYAFDLSRDSENIVGPMIFRSTDTWKYEVLRHG